MTKFKDVLDLMSKIDINRPKNAVLCCNIDCIPYLTKLIPEFQLSEHYQDTLNRGHGFVGWYQDDKVFVQPTVPSKNIIWIEIPEGLEYIGDSNE